MKTNQLYSDGEEINIDTYLKKCGIDDVKMYLNPDKNVLDNPSIYTNMDKAVDEIIEYLGVK